MRTNQWNVLGIAFLFLSWLFGYLSNSWRSSCVPDVFSGWNLVSCIRSQIFAPFPYIFFVLAIACGINSWLEGKAEKKEKGLSQ